MLETMRQTPTVSMQREQVAYAEWLVDEVGRYESRSEAILAEDLSQVPEDWSEEDGLVESTHAGRNGGETA